MEVENMSHLVEKEFFEYDDEVMDCSGSCWGNCSGSCGSGNNNYY